MTYKEFMGLQDATRSELLDFINEKKISFSDLAKEIGINIGTLSRFVKYEENVQMRTFSKIQDYMRQQKDK